MARRRMFAGDSRCAEAPNAVALMLNMFTFSLATALALYVRRTSAAQPRQPTTEIRMSAEKRLKGKRRTFSP